MSLKTLLLILVCSCGAFEAGCSLGKSKQAKAQNSNQAAPQDGNQSAARSDEVASANSSSGQGGNASAPADISDELHTPERGSEERQAIMDALRASLDNYQSPYYQPHRGTITFVVNFLKVHNGWAWMNGSPQSTNSQDSFGEFSGFLLHTENGKWIVMSLPPMVNDPDDPENLDYPGRRDIEKIRQKYPKVATDIFPRS
jgi:hypothetical protein